MAISAETTVNSLSFDSLYSSSLSPIYPENDQKVGAVPEAEVGPAGEAEERAEAASP